LATAGTEWKRSNSIGPAGVSALESKFDSAADGLVAMLVSMSDESDSKTYEERAWQYFLQLQPSIADVNAAAELAFRAVDAFDKGLKRRRGKDS
jgi:hypothetical protein